MEKILNRKVRILLLCLVGMLMAVKGVAQAIIVKGSVKDKTGEAIIGANVLVKGTTNGTITDFNGNFALDAKKGDILVISYIGFRNQELPAASDMKITLVEDAEILDDVIVIGYATGSQRTVSGAIQRVGREDMNVGVVTNPLQAIKGKVAGVNIQKTGGDPTASASIRVRGTTSLSGGNDPLVIVDGVFGDLNMLNAISPADIESFTILKDASETAQYGSRGASGVIVVTTIKGKNGTKSLSYDGSFGVETVYKNLSMLDASAYRQVVADRGYANAMDMGYNTNFIEAMQQTGYTQNHRISFGGGTESSNYRASIGVIDQKGIASWDGAYGVGDDTPAGSMTVGDGLNNLTVSEPGYYYVKCNINDLTWSADVVNFGVIGSATPGQWDEDTDLVYDETDLKLKVTITLTDGEIKFRANDEWNVPNGDFGAGEEEGKLAAGAGNIAVSAGTYQIVVDLSTPDYSYEMIAQ